MEKLRKIAIVGIFGSGKTTLGNLLAKKGVVFHQDLSAFDYIYARPHEIEDMANIYVDVESPQFNAYKTLSKYFLDKGAHEFAKFWRSSMDYSQHSMNQVIHNLQSNSNALVEFQPISELGQDSAPAHAGKMVVATAESDPNIFIAEGVSFNKNVLEEMDSIHVVEAPIEDARNAIWTRQRFAERPPEDRAKFEFKFKSSQECGKILLHESLAGFEYKTKRHFNPRSAGMAGLNEIAEKIIQGL